MEIIVEKKENCVTELRISLPSERVEQEAKKRLARLSNTAQIPGFRAGKVPIHLVERYYGPKAEQEALEQITTEVYNEAIKEKGVKAIIPPTLSQFNYKKGESLSFVATVETLPGVDLGKYKGITVNKRAVKVSDKQVNHALESLQERYTQLVIADSQRVEKGHVVIIDFKSFKDNQLIPQGQRENYCLEVGMSGFPDRFDEALIGLERGQTKEFDVLMPDDFGDKHLANQVVRFKVNLKEIKKKIVPPLDDDLAKDIGEFETIDEVKEALRQDLIQAAEFEVHKEMKDQLLLDLSQRTNVTLPNSLIEHEIDYMLLNLGYNLAQQGVKIKKENIRDVEKLRQEFRPGAITRVKGAVILETIANQEKIDLTEEEYKDWVLNTYRGEPEKVRICLEDKDKKAALMEELKHEKTLNFLLANADIKVIEGKEEK